jgi:hypothetical protein
MSEQPAPGPAEGQAARPAAPRQIARCPSCGAVLAQEPGSAAQAIDNLYQEVTKLREIAELKEAAEAAERTNRRAGLQWPTPRELELQEEIRQLRATVARLRATSRVTTT